MADISKCVGATPTNEVCPKRDLCYRYTAPTNQQWQSWFAAPPAFLEGKCEMYWENDHAKNQATEGHDEMGREFGARDAKQP